MKKGVRHLWFFPPLILMAVHGVLFFQGVGSYLSLSKRAEGHYCSYHFVEESPFCFKPEFTYDFFYAGKRYTVKERIDLPLFGSKEEVQKKVPSYRLNTVVRGAREEGKTIYYDPRSPAEGVFKRKWPWKEGGYFFLSFGVLLYFFYLKRYIQEWKVH